jgi:hypothetical protein
LEIKDEESTMKKERWMAKREVGLRTRELGKRKTKVNLGRGEDRGAEAPGFYRRAVYCAGDSITIGLAIDHCPLMTGVGLTIGVL